MKRLHKLLVLVLTVAMLLGVIAVSAFAADATVAKIGDVEYTSLADALAAANAVTAEEGTTPDPITIILTRSTALDAEDVISVNVPGLDLTIDLGGHNLDVSAVAASETELVKAVFYAEAQGSSLTVKNGAISSRSTDNGVFAIKDGNNTEIKIENVSVNLEGALNAPVINARSGKVTVVDSNFVTYGDGSVVVRQANDSEVLISDSTLINADGVSPLSAIFKIEGSATAKLTGETEADVRPHVSVENSEMYALANVIIGVISGDSRPIGRVSTWVSFKGCDIEQCNLSKYNAEINLLSSSNNRILKGNYCNVDFDDCDVEYARVAFETNEAQNINVKNSTFTMTNLGQTQYSNAVTGQITACPSYFVMGKGNVSVSDSMLYLAPTGTNTWAPIADSNAISYAQSLDIQEIGGLEICNGTVVNTNEDLKTLKVLEIGCRAFELSKGYYIGYQSFEFDVWSDKWYTPGKYVAKLNGVKYTSFADAYVMARDGDEIRLLADVIGIVSIEKDISVINFNGYKFSHTSTSYKATATRGYTSFAPARSFELVRVILVTDSGNEEFTVAAGNYANYSREILEGWYVNGYKVVKFLGWGTTPGDYSLGTALPFIDGSNSTVKVYGAYEELYNLDADYMIVDASGNFVEWGGSFEELLEPDAMFNLNKDFEIDTSSSPNTNVDTSKNASAKIIVLLKDIHLQKSAEFLSYGTVYLDLNGFSLTTDNVPVINSQRKNIAYHVDADGNTIKTYTSNTTVNASNWQEGHSIVIPENASTTARKKDSYFFIFSSREGAKIDTGNAPVFFGLSVSKITITKPDGSKTVLEVNDTGFSLGNEKILNATLKSRLKDNVINVNCSSLIDGSAGYSHYTWVDDAIVVGNESTYGIFRGNDEKKTYNHGAMNGALELYNSVFINTAPGGPIFTVRTASNVFKANNCVFITTLGEGGKVPKLMNGMGYDTDNVAAEFNNCGFINCMISYSTNLKPGKKETMAIKGGFYNILGATNDPEATSSGPYAFKLADGYVAVEDANCGVAYKVGDKTYYAPYKIITGTAPQKVEVTWIYDGEETKELYYSGASVSYDGVALGIETVDGKPYSNVMGYEFALSDSTVNLKSIDRNVTITVTKKVTDIKADVNVNYNVTVSDKLTLSIFVPVNEAITKISLMTANGENLIDGEEDGYYRITSQPISPNEIHREIVYAITVSDGVNTDVQYVRVSILGYIKAVLADSEASDELISVVNALLLYADESYKYFDGEANAEVAALLGDNTQDAPTASTSKNVDGISDKVLFVSLKLNSRIAFVFEVADGVETVNVGGVDYAVTDSSVTCFIDIAAANDAINITVGEATGVYDLIAYIDSVGTAGAAYSVACALYNLAASLDAYAAV